MWDWINELFVSVSWWAYFAAAIVVLVLASLLHYLNPVKFPIVASIPAVFVYVVIAWPLLRFFLRVVNSDARKSNGGKFREIMQELLGGAALVAIGFVAGCLGGAVWWFIAGSNTTSLMSAILAGGGLGCLPALLALGG